MKPGSEFLVDEGPDFLKSAQDLSFPLDIVCDGVLSPNPIGHIEWRTENSDLAPLYGRKSENERRLYLSESGSVVHKPLYAVAVHLVKRDIIWGENCEVGFVVSENSIHSCSVHESAKCPERSHRRNELRLLLCLHDDHNCFWKEGAYPTAGSCLSFHLALSLGGLSIRSMTCTTPFPDS